MPTFKDLLTFRIAKHALGKYIIAYAALLHVFWAALLFFDIRAANATPLSVMFAILGSRPLVIAVLIVVAAMGGMFLNLRLRAVIGLKWLALLLVPQQTVLLCSAGAGIYAAIIQRYADGVVKCWAQISADQAPIILMAILYSIAVIEATQVPSIDGSS